MADTLTAQETSQSTVRTIAVIDGNSLMHRAFHAVAAPMTAPDGTPTNAIFGFLSMFAKMVDTFKPDGIMCAFDRGKPLVRMQMLPQYKAQRPPMDDSLHKQFPLIKELLHTLDIPVVECEGWEGDDILGTLARAGEAAGYDMYLVTGDRDMYQLVTEHVNVVSTRKGMSDVAIMTPESVDDLYHGITPDLVPDFYGLKGDTSDNIPGVPGIGPKKASALIVQYGSLDGVIEHASEVPGKMGENLRAHIDDALLSRKVATIRTDAPISCDFDAARWPTFDAGEVQQAFGALGITSLTKRILAFAGPQSTATTTPVATLELSECLSGEALVKALAAAGDAGEWLGLTVAEPQDQGTLFAPDLEIWASCKAGYGKLEGESARSFIAKAFLRYHVAASDIKSLIHEVYPTDSAMPAYSMADGTVFDPALCTPQNLFDTAVGAYLLNSDSGSYAAQELAAQYLEALIPAPSETTPVAALGAVINRELVGVLLEKLKADGSLELMNTIEMPLLLVLARMERTGMHAEAAVFAEQARELGIDIEASRKRIFEAAGKEFNVDSPKQLSAVLFEDLGLPTAGLKKTASGYSTNAKVLESLRASYPIVDEVLRYREKNKIKTTYLDAFPSLIAGDGRIHTSLNQTIAATGRLSSSNPNLQNIPTRSELGHRVRKAFTVDADNVFLTCDYSQIELRLLAHLSGDEHLISAFREGEDFHAQTAARVFGIPVSEVTHEQRSRAKAVNFGIVYGQQAYGLSASLGISRKEAQEMIDRYYSAYPGVRVYLDAEVALARKNLWVETMYGRKRHMPNINSKNFAERNFAERTAMNHPMQGSAADIIKLAMVAVDKRMRQEKVASKLILQIHDELDFEVPISELELMSKLVKEAMEGVVELKVPLVAEVSYGSDWAEAK